MAWPFHDRYTKESYSRTTINSGLPTIGFEEVCYPEKHITDKRYLDHSTASRNVDDELDAVSKRSTATRVQCAV